MRTWQAREAMAAKSIVRLGKRRGRIVVVSSTPDDRPDQAMVRWLDDQSKTWIDLDQTLDPGKVSN